MGIDFRRPRHIRGFRLGEVLIFGPGIGRVLVEKTVSGAIAHIEDGADDVPTKSLVVTIAPTLTGVSSIAVTQTGKNLFGGWTKGLGINSTTGEIFPRQDSAISEYISVVPNTNYYISGFSNEISSMVAYYDRNKTYISRTSGSQRLSLAVTTPANCRYMILYQYRAGDQTASIDVIDNMQTQLEVGNQQTAHVPYTAPTTHTANLGRTIYGGEVDVVKGTGKNNCKKIALGDFTWIKSGTEGNFYCQQITDLWYPSEGGISRYGIGVSDEFEFVQGTPADGQINAYFNTAYSGYRIFIKKEDYADKTSAEFKEYLQSINAHLVYMVNDASVTDFTFEPVEINTRLGYNAFWSDEGDTEVTYYAYAD